MIVGKVVRELGWCNLPLIVLRGWVNSVFVCVRSKVGNVQVNSYSCVCLPEAS